MLTASDYLSLYETAILTTQDGALKELDYIGRVSIANRALYQCVQNASGIPWPLIAAIHYRESDQSFRCHLHNGDPLTARTVHVPAGRPAEGLPPFPWQTSAIDALSSAWRPDSWDLPSCLEFLERYNGLGYQKHSVNSPYLWDYTNHYAAGLFVADGTFDPKKKEARPGCVAILKTLESKGVSLDFTALDLVESLLH